MRFGNLAKDYFKIVEISIHHHTVPVRANNSALRNQCLLMSSLTLVVQNVQRQLKCCRVANNARTGDRNE